MLKKYISVMLIMVLFIILCFCSYKSNNKGNRQFTLVKAATMSKSDNSLKNTNKNKIIVIDPGHACKTLLEKEPIAPNLKVMKPKNVIGVVGIVTKTPEYVINLKVALK